jgi:hypothetical protein
MSERPPPLSDDVHRLTRKPSRSGAPRVRQMGSRAPDGLHRHEGTEMLV